VGTVIKALLGLLALSGLLLGPGPRAEPAPLDQEAALAYSQAAVGKTLGDYSLLDRHGRPVRLAELRGKPLVVSLVYTSCYEICPTTTRHLAKAVRTARQVLGDDSFRVLTIGFDAGFDRPDTMRDFARKQGVDLPSWWFLSGEAETVAALARDLGFLYRRSPKGYDHLLQTTLVDREGRVYRQVYGEVVHTPLLVEPLKELVFGVKPNENLWSGLLNRVRLFCTVYDPSSDRYKFDYSLFIEIAIGATLIGLIAAYLVRETRRARSRPV